MACVACPDTLHASLNAFSSFESAFTLFQSHNVIPQIVICTTCGGTADFNVKLLRWRCQQTNIINGRKVKCTFNRTLKSLTKFTGSHLDIATIGKLFVLYLLVPPPHHDLIQNELKLSPNTVVSRSALVRHIQHKWCQINIPQSFGGPGTIVEVDEAKFGRQKYNRGRQNIGQWILGGVQRGTTNISLEVVADRSQETLMEVIHRRILPGTTIITDCF